MAATISVSTVINGETQFASVTCDEDAAISAKPANPAGKQSSAWTKSDSNTGTATLGTGHGIITSDKVAVFWEGGSRYDMDATVDGNDVIVDGGDGDDLPASSTTVYVCRQIDVNICFDPDDMIVLLASTDRRAVILFKDAEDNVLLPLDLAAGRFMLWFSGCGLDRPMTGNAVAKVTVANGSTSAGTVKVSALYDPTP